MITVELIPDPEEGGFTARLPDLPAYGEGDTEEAAIADLRPGGEELLGAAVQERHSCPGSKRRMRWTMPMLPAPEMRTTPNPPRPEGVEMATMVSRGFNGFQQDV